MARSRRLDGRRLYLCCPDRPDLPRFLAACIRGGVDVVQLRDKSLEARPLLARARLALEVCRQHGVPFILNDRPDLALELGADGVHVGQDDAPPTLARRIVGPDALVGLSTHDPAQLEAAAREPVDYLSAAAHTDRPFFVTGGVTAESVAKMVEAGGRRFVVVRFLTEAGDPEDRARVLRRALDGALAAVGAPEA